MDQFLELVKGDTGTNLVGMSSSTLSGGYSTVPKDATVHELTSNTIWFIEHLFDHFDVIGGVLQHDTLYAGQFDAYAATHKTMQAEDRNKILLGLYISECSACARAVVYGIVSIEVNRVFSWLQKKFCPN